MKAKGFDFETFVRERDEALLSLDLSKVRVYAQKYKTPFPEDDELALATVHKAITALSNASEEAKAKSLLWLAERGMRPL